MANVTYGPHALAHLKMLIDDLNGLAIDTGLLADDITLRAENNDGNVIRIVSDHESFGGYFADFAPESAPAVVINQYHPVGENDSEAVALTARFLAAQ